MKKQLIIATIACAVSGAAFAATEGSHTINLRVDEPTSILEIGGSILAGETTVSFATPDALELDKLRKRIGNITLTASNYPTSAAATCRIYAESDWTLSAGSLSAKYGLIRHGQPLASNTVSFGYSSQTSGVLNSTDRSGGFFTNLGQALADGTTAPAPLGTCSINEELDVLINGFAKPTVSTTTTLTDTITFKVVVI